MQFIELPFHSCYWTLKNIENPMKIFFYYIIHSLYCISVRNVSYSLLNKVKIRRSPCVPALPAPSGESVWRSIFKWATASRLRSTASATLTHQAWLISRSHLQSIKHTCKCMHINTHAHATSHTNAYSEAEKSRKSAAFPPLAAIYLMLDRSKSVLMLIFT